MTSSAPHDPAHEAAGVGTDVFISYSRHDRDDVVALSEQLELRGRSVWVDWSGIAPTAEWMAEIRRGIDAADTVVFALSPAAVSSPVCSEELEYAVKQRKRIVPVVVRDVPSVQVPPELARLQWLRLGASGVAGLADDLVGVLDTDLQAVRIHTRLTVRAAEWESSGRDSGLLLRGAELAAAETWLTTAGRGPEPTAAQVALISASRRSASRRQRSLLAAVSTALVAALLLGLIAVTQRRSADEQATAAQHQALVADAQKLGAVAQSVDDPALGVLLAAAGQRLVDSSSTRSALLATLERWDGLVGTYTWGSPITSLTAGAQGTLWLSDGTHVDQLRLDEATPGASLRISRLRQEAAGLSSDESGRWVVLSRPSGVLGVPGTPSERTSLEQDLLLVDTAQLGKPVLIYSRQPYAWLPRPGSPVQPVVSGGGLVTVDALAVTTYLSSAQSGSAADPGELRTGSRLRSWPVSVFPRVAQTYTKFQPDPWPSRAVDLGGQVRALSATGGGRVLAAVAGSTSAVVELDAATLRVRHRWAVPVAPASVAGLPDGGAVVGATDGTLLLLEPDGRVRRTRSAHRAAIRRLAVSPDGTSIAAGSVDGVVTVRGLDGAARWVHAPGAAVTGLVWTPSGRGLVEADRGGSLRVYDVDPARALSPVMRTGLPQPWSGGTQVRLSADGRVLAVVGRHSDTASSGRLALVDLAGGAAWFAAVPGRARRTVTTPVSVALDGSGTSAVVASQDGLTAYRRSGDRLELRSTPNAARPPDDESADVAESVEMSSDATALAYLAGASSPLSRSDSGHPQVVGAIDPATLQVRGRRLSPRGPSDPDEPNQPLYYGTMVAGTDPEKPLLTCGIGCFQRADLEAEALRPASVPVDDMTAQLARGRARVRVAATGGGVVVEGTDGGFVRLFAGDPLAPVAPWATAQGGRVQSAAVSADGLVAATGGTDGTALLWDARTGSRIGAPIHVGASTDYVSVALSSGSLLTVDTQGTLRRTPTSASEWVALACRKAGRDLTAEEWATYLPGRSQVALCTSDTASVAADGS